MNTITGDLVRKTFHYDPETGLLTWKVRPNRRIKIGSIAGSSNWNGYILVSVNNKRLRAHRVIWMYVYDKWPDYDVDHINGVPHDNRLQNLRDVSTARNIQNQRRPQKRNKCGYLGVSLCPLTKKWRARICTNGKHVLIGRFQTPELASQAYWKAKSELHQ